MTIANVSTEEQFVAAGISVGKMKAASSATPVPRLDFNDDIPPNVEAYSPDRLPDHLKHLIKDMSGDFTHEQ